MSFELNLIKNFVVDVIQTTFLRDKTIIFKLSSDCVNLSNILSFVFYLDDTDMGI